MIEHNQEIWGYLNSKCCPEKIISLVFKAANNRAVVVESVHI